MKSSLIMMMEPPDRHHSIRPYKSIRFLDLDGKALDQGTSSSSPA